MTIELGSLPASAAMVSWTGTAGCDRAIDVAGFKRALDKSRRLRRGGPAPSAPPTCPAGDQRFIQYGLLGPDATSITYALGGLPQIERTHGPDGAYLVVGPATPAFCAQLPRTGFCGSNGTAPNSLFGGMILSVRYRDGRTCQPAGLEARRPAFALRCPRLGYVAPKSLLHESQLAAPVSVRVLTAKHYCFTRNDYLNPGSGPAPATDTGPYIPCDGPVPANEIRDPLHAHGWLIVFSWTAREPVTSPSSRYEFTINKPCGGGGSASTYGRIRAGERLTRGMFEPRGCTFTGSVSYNPNVGPGGLPAAPMRRFGRNGSILVGHFSITIR